MCESKFWLGVWSILGVVLISGVMLTQGYYKTMDDKMMKLVKDGHSPVEVAIMMGEISSVELNKLLLTGWKPSK